MLYVPTRDFVMIHNVASTQSLWWCFFFLMVPNVDRTVKSLRQLASCETERMILSLCEMFDIVFVWKG